MKYAVLVLVIVFNFVALKAQTDTTQVKSLFDYTLEELMELKISGASRYIQSVSDVPNSIQVISQQQIQDRAYYDLSDLLKDVEGIDLTANAGRFGEFYSIRGISGNDRFLILINGHKLNPASGTFISVGNSISIRHAQRVEIIYGSASAIYGADAFSGIINIVFDDVISEEEINTNISGYANYGNLNTFDGGLQGNFKVNKNLSFNFSGRVYKSDNYDIIKRDKIYDIINQYRPPIKNEFEQPTNDHSIYFNAKYKNFSLNYYRHQFDQGNAMGLNPEIYIYDKTNKWKTSTDIIWATYSKKFKNEGNLTLDVSYKYHKQDKNTIFHGWMIPGIMGEDYKQFMTGKDNTVRGLLTYNQLVSDKFQFIVGVDNEYTTSIPPYANDEVLGSSYKYEGENAKLIDEQLTITENRSSGFGQLIYTPIKVMNVVLGARYDYSTRYQGIFNPRIGVILSPTNTSKIKMVYGKSFQAPSLFYQYEQFGAPTITMLSTTEIQKTNPDWKLENQIVNSYEISFTQKINKNFKFKIDAYYNDLTNLIERNLYASYPADSVYNKYFDKYTSGLRNENIGSQKIIGGDFSFDAKITKNILLYTYYSFTDAISVMKTGEEMELPRIANHKVWLGITVQNLFDYLTVSSRFRWSSDMYNANSTVFPTNRQPSFYTLDVNLSLNNLHKNIRFYANFENITNNKYGQAGLYGQRGVYTATIPQQEFTFKTGVEVFFNGGKWFKPLH